MSFGIFFLVCLDACVTSQESELKLSLPTSTCTPISCWRCGDCVRPSAQRSPASTTIHAPARWCRTQIEFDMVVQVEGH